MDSYEAIKNRILTLVRLDGRLDMFDRTFHRILRDTDVSYANDIISDDGIINIENLKRITDRLGTGSIDFYRKERHPATGLMTGRCVRLPSKDLLLLIAVCLELEPDTVSDLLSAAGYNDYVKNLKEFIIFCGLHNIKSLEEISAKLFDYGYREQDALMAVQYKEDQSAMVSFSTYFDRLCAAKGLDKKEVLERAALLSPTQDADINKYYNSAFYGQKAVKIQLTGAQVLALFDALDLDAEEQTAYMDFLNGLSIISEEDVELLLSGVKETLRRRSTGDTAYPDIGDNSVFTQYLSTQLQFLPWERLDSFIPENFGTIRSFAVFYGQLIHHEGFKNISQFCSAFSLSAKSHYNYIAGVSLPTMATLTATAFLFRRMTVQIFNTMLKKAGKYIFDSEDDSAVYLLAKELLSLHDRQSPLFGTLFDCCRSLIGELRESDADEDLLQLYGELLKILARFLLSYMKDTVSEHHTVVVGALRSLAQGQNNQPTQAALLAGSDTVLRALQSAGVTSPLRTLLRERFGFSPSSPLLSWGPEPKERVVAPHG